MAVGVNFSYNFAVWRLGYYSNNIAIHSLSVHSIIGATLRRLSFKINKLVIYGAYSSWLGCWFFRLFSNVSAHSLGAASTMLALLT